MGNLGTVSVAAPCCGEQLAIPLRAGRPGRMPDGTVSIRVSPDRRAVRRIARGHRH
ncbi:MAG: hypothetical protein JWP14_3392 [Frankiales bacterium]|nr:hypothetical protein [Frankiales bacterium]